MSHRSHAYSKANGGVPDQDPDEDVSVAVSTAVPEIVGGPLFEATVVSAAAAALRIAATMTAPPTSTALERDGRGQRSVRP